MFVMHLLIFSAVLFFFYNTLTKDAVFKFLLFITILLVLSTVALGRFLVDGYTPVQIIFMAITRIIERVLLTKGVVTSYVFEFFPDEHEYLTGESYFQALLGNMNDNIPLSQLMFSYIVGGSGTAGPQTFGEFYANFGPIGVILCFCVGFILQVISILMIRVKSMSPLKAAYMAYFIFLLGLIGYGKLLSFKTYGLHVLVAFITMNLIVLSVVKYASEEN